MKIALLGYGKEGQAAEKYFAKQGASFEIFTDFTAEEIRAKDLSSYDMVLRSPSVPPTGKPNETSLTRYFFEHCPCRIIGVTATKGKGTTCSFIRALLEAHGEDVHLVGNIGTPAIEILDSLTENSVVVYEMSSFQLWDLAQSPQIAVVGTIEPDHLNVHNGFKDYISAKSNIARHQSASDHIIYYSKNAISVRIANTSPAVKVAYPFDVAGDILAGITLPGRHNQENAMAAIAAVASYYNLGVNKYLAEYGDTARRGLSSFRGLPHRLEFVRELNGIRFYDDNFSTNPASTKVAIEAFPGDDVVLIVGGRDKTGNEDIPEIYATIMQGNVKRIILMGESGHELAQRYSDERFVVVESLEDAVKKAVELASNLVKPVVLMSPSAASFDMFKNVYDRGARYQKIINSL